MLSILLSWRSLPVMTIIFVFMASSCVKDVILDAKERPQVAVACILSDDPVQELRLSFSKGASLKAPPLIEAKAVLKDLNFMEEREFERQEDGVWRLDYAAVPGHKYRLEVTVPEYEPIWAEETMPAPVQANERRKYDLRDMVESPTGYIGKPSLDEEPEPHSYDSGIWLDGDDLPRGESYWVVGALNDPVWIYALNYNTATGKRELADEICTDYYGVDNFNLTGRIYIPPKWEEAIPYPVKRQYAELLANTHIKALYPELDGMPMHLRYLRIPPKELERAINMLLSGSFKGKYNAPDNFVDEYFLKHWGRVRDLAADEGYVVWTAVSESLDNYLKEAIKYQDLLASTDLTTIYLRDNMPTNINYADGTSALGVFGCKLEQNYQWSAEGTYFDIDWKATDE